MVSNTFLRKEIQGVPVPFSTFQDLLTLKICIFDSMLIHIATIRLRGVHLTISKIHFGFQ